MKRTIICANLIKIAQGIRPGGVYIPKFGKTLVKFLVLGLPSSLHRWGKIWQSTPPCQISPSSVQRVTLRGEKKLKIAL